LFRGVARPSLEWDPNGNLISAADFQAMASWHANVVRIALNQDFWLSGAALYSPTYAAVVDGAVKAAEAAGLDVILDLHWSDEGNLGVTVSGKTQDNASNSNQQPMADVNSKQFWTEVAMKYKDDGHVLFELYNEPHNISWSVWLNGGGTTYPVVGMQQLYDAVRATGANNIVIAGGLSYAFDLSGVGGNPIVGQNVMYASHPYKPQDAQTLWESSFGYLATQDIAPVITTEFGDTTPTTVLNNLVVKTCTGQWNSDLITFNDAHEISWTAWAWFVADPCQFPSVISDWSGTPSVQGVPVKAALLGYPYQPGGTLTLGTAGAGGATGSAGSAGLDDGGAAGTFGAGAGGSAAGTGGGSGAIGAATGGMSGSAGASGGGGASGARGGGGTSGAGTSGGGGVAG
jgi:aryl-phospho-beta-D-glucosidase BglC (GH1 family)